MDLAHRTFVFLAVPTLVGLVHACFWFLIALRLKRNDVADVAWGLGMILMSLATVGCVGFAMDRASLALLLVAVWGLRLSIHIGLRNSRKGEDFRYRAWREKWGSSFHVRTFLQVFLLQAALAVLIVSPITFIGVYRGGALNWLDVISVAIWGFGFFFETLGDWQLARFKADPRSHGKIIMTGLWRYTRHPNYFGEVIQWWGLWLLALSVPHGWMTLPGPVTITLLILKVSGIPLLEEKMRGDPRFGDYVRDTSAFIPWIPRKSVNPRVL